MRFSTTPAEQVAERRAIAREILQTAIKARNAAAELDRQARQAADKEP